MRITALFMTIDVLIAASALPRIEAELLVATAMKQNRTWVFAHGDVSVPSDVQNSIENCFARRRAGEPVAYIIGEREFFGRTFGVTPAVLIPRPATEQLVERALEYLAHPHDTCTPADAGISIVSKVLRPGLHPAVVVDCGTGSGCIAITLALECGELQIIATDSSSAALEVARQNAERHGVADRIDVRQGDGLAPVTDLQQPFLLVANPPYIPAGAVLERQVAEHEPAMALYAGDDGGDIIRMLVKQARECPQCVGMLCECQTNQAIWLTSA
ncbi:MAG: peptide chain release factor N(5)-glutamine methyltransferase [Candidatus Peregrinibacteria bacterium]